MTRTTLSIIGVPEHFNLPWRLLIDSQPLVAQGITLNWQDVPEGTGEMIDMLERGEADLALLLTEGAIAGIANGARHRILGAWIDSPLQWGVHVAAQSALHTVDDLIGRRFAISRYGSGSHLMASVYAEQQTWPSGNLEFVVVNNLAGARRALADGDADIFLWERFTTKPYVDNGEFRRVDILPTPWLCFVACTADGLSPETLAAAQLALRAACRQAASLLGQGDAAALFADRYKLQQDDVRDWLTQTRWSTDGGMPGDLLTVVGNALKRVNMIESVPDAATVFSDLNQ